MWCADGVIVFLTTLTGQDDKRVVAAVLQLAQEIHVMEHDGKEGDASAAGAKDIPVLEACCDGEFDFGEFILLFHRHLRREEGMLRIR